MFIESNSLFNSFNSINVKNLFLSIPNFYKKFQYYGGSGVTVTYDSVEVKNRVQLTATASKLKVYKQKYTGRYII